MFKAMLSWQPDAERVRPARVAYLSFGTRLDAEIFLASFRPNENAMIEIFEVNDAVAESVSDATR